MISLRKLRKVNESLLGLIVSPAKREITFRGAKQGKTSVTIRDAAGDIRDKFIVDITATGVSGKVMELRQLIGEVEGIDIVINPMHVMHLKNLEIDFEQGLNNRGFIYNNPNADTTCGCGTSFS